MSTIDLNTYYPPDLTTNAMNITVCSGAMRLMSVGGPAVADNYAAIVEENKQLKAEIVQLKARLAELEQ